MTEPSEEERTTEDKPLDFYPSKQEIEANLKECGVPEGVALGLLGE